MNKTETQVELLFDVTHSPSLTDQQRQRILRQLKNLIDRGGVLRVPKKRKPTNPTAASKARRIEGKKRRGQIKQLHRSKPDE